ncbi:unnamed protein product [Alopecurus aequalis]
MAGAAAPPRLLDSPPALPLELVEEILLRLPPDDPACLLRASVVCKTWQCAVSSPGFRRRLHELHPTPPVLGFLHNWEDKKIPGFIPTTASSFSLAAPDRRSWRPLDCRHGRALFLSEVGQAIREILLWEPITGAQQRIPVPPSKGRGWPTAAVFCAADGCNHSDCHGGAFRLVFVFAVDEYITSACLYSPETGTYGELTSVKHDGDFKINFNFSTSLLVGKQSLLYFMSDDWSIVEYDLARHALTVFDPPQSQYFYDSFNLMLVEDGGLGLVQALDPNLKLWSRKVSSDGTNAQWVPGRVIYLENLLPDDALMSATRALHVLGFAEGANVIFVLTVAGLFTIELQSKRVRKVYGNRGFGNFIPVVSFYTPLPCGEHQD